MDQKGNNMKNLAISYPKKELESEEYLFISKENELHKKLNRHFPPPKYIMTTCRFLVEQNVESYEIKELYEEKPKVVEFYEQAIKDLDTTVVAELQEAGIFCSTQVDRVKGEVPAKYIGYLFLGLDKPRFSFERAWRYWMVDIDPSIDIELAEIIYKDPIGNEYIRTNGYAGNTDPKDEKSVKSYHIDTQEALNQFVKLVSDYYNKK